MVKAMALGAAAAGVLILIAELMDPLTSGALDSARRNDGDLMTALVVIVTAVVGGISFTADGWLPRVELSRRTKIAILVAGGVAVLIGIALIGPVDRIRDFTAAPAPEAQATLTGASSHGRWQFWSSAVDALASSPGHGLGAGGWESYWGLHSTIPRFARNPHSLPLQSAAELGIPGIALLLGLTAVIALAAWRRLRRPRRGDAPVLTAVIAAAAIGAAVDWTWQIPAVIGPAIICSGLLVASAPPPLKGSQAWEGWITLGIAWGAMVASTMVLAGDIELRASRAATADGRLDDAIEHARDATTFQPWASAPYVQLALVREQQKMLPLALADLREAIERDRGDWRLSIIEARLESKNGDTIAAGKALKRSRAESPFNVGSG
jgi:O-antigen ligase